MPKFLPKLFSVSIMLVIGLLSFHFAGAETDEKILPYMEKSGYLVGGSLVVAYFSIGAIADYYVSGSMDEESFNAGIDLYESFVKAIRDWAWELLNLAEGDTSIINTSWDVINASDYLANEIMYLKPYKSSGSKSDAEKFDEARKKGMDDYRKISVIGYYRDFGIYRQ